MEIIIQSIKRRIAFSDDILYICFQYEIVKKKRKPKAAILFNTIKSEILDILAHTRHKKDWFFMKNYLLSSAIWYIKINPSEDKSKFLWYEAFEWVDLETKRQSSILSKPMREIENKHLAKWTKLISHDVKQAHLC